MEYSVINPNGKKPVLRIKVSGSVANYSIMSIAGISYSRSAIPAGSFQVTIDRDGIANVFTVPERDIALIDEIITVWTNAINGVS